MSTVTDALQLLERWKARPFHTYDISLADAAASIERGKPLVEYRPYGNPSWADSLTKWTVCHPRSRAITPASSQLSSLQVFPVGGNQPAVFHTAAIYLYGSPHDSGNLVPSREPTEGVLPSQMHVHSGICGHRTLTRPTGKP